MQNEKVTSKIILPSGRPAQASESPRTERKEARRREDEAYLPVIIKRTDESRVHPDDILERAIEGGLEQLKRPGLSLLLSSIAAGLILGFSAMAVAVVAEAMQTESIPLVKRIAMALVYPLGFIICIMSGSQLFTEHTATAVYPILDRRGKISSLFRLWAIVIAGNLCGTFISAYLISFAGPVINADNGYLEIAKHLLSPGFMPLLVSAVLAGWLMAQGAWMLLASPPQSSQIIYIYLVTFLIGIGGLHHSIAGSAEIFTAVILSKKYLWMDALYFISTALLGNLIGGSTFVATLNYAHIRQTQSRRQSRSIR